MAEATTDREAGEPVMRFEDGGTGRLAFGIGMAVTTCLFAYGPLVASILFPDAIEDNSIGLWILWAICLSGAVWVAAQMQIRELTEIDKVQQLVRITSTSCFLVTRKRQIPFRDVAAVEVATNASDDSDELQPLPLPVLRLQSGEIVSIAAQNYASGITSIDADRQKKAQDLVAAVRALILPAVETQAA
jgi:hypothetical protein